MVDTPGFITYNTPYTVGPLSPEQARVEQTTAPTPPTWGPELPSSSSSRDQVQLTWSGRTKAEYDAMQDEGQRLERLGKAQEAGCKYRDALAGLQHLMPFMHDDTVSLAYQLASFYAKNNRMRDADAVLDWLNTSAVEAWGIGDRRTIAHLERVVDMLQSWSRAEDAVPLICRLGKAPAAENARTASDETDDVAMIEYKLAITRIQTKALPNNAELMLLELLDQCNQWPERYPSQNLRAWTTLVDLYQREENFAKQRYTLDCAAASFSAVIKVNQVWTFSLYQSALDLISRFLDAKLYDAADQMFNMVADEAECTFGDNSENTIRLTTNIGMQYQKAQRWGAARPFFERALSASMTAYGFDDDRTVRLEEALENGHYEPCSTQSPRRADIWQHWNINRRAKPKVRAIHCPF